MTLRFEYRLLSVERAVLNQGEDRSRIGWNVNGACPSRRPLVRAGRAWEQTLSLRGPDEYSILVTTITVSGWPQELSGQRQQGNGVVW